MAFAVHEAAAVLRTLFRGRGVDPDPGPSLAAGWEVFQEFAAVPRDGSGPADDGILYESGTFRGSGHDTYVVALVRQFEVPEPDGEHDHFEQVRSEWRFRPTEETRSFGPFSRWWFRDGGESWASFVAAVESRPEFQALADVPAAASEVTQEVV
jgi:hypothetical protein